MKKLEKQYSFDEVESLILKADQLIREGNYYLDNAVYYLGCIPKNKIRCDKLNAQINKIEDVISFIKYNYKI